MRHDVHLAPPLTRWSELQRFINPWYAEDTKDTNSGSASGAIGTAEHQMSRLPRVVVPHDIWNDYWLQYSEACGDHVERLQMALSSTYSDTNSHSASYDYGSSDSFKRCVQVSLFSTGDIPKEEKSSMSIGVVLSFIVFYARQCGAVENVLTAPIFSDGSANIKSAQSSAAGTAVVLGWIQFTTESAAKMFRLWINGWKLNSLCSQFRSDISAFFPELLILQDLSKQHGKENETGLLDLLEDFSKDSNTTFTTTLTPSCTKGTTKLCLGPNIFLSTAFLNSLFCGMMDATSVVYCQEKDNSFIISFKDKDAALLALHALQYSLWVVFGLSLVTITDK